MIFQFNLFPFHFSSFDRNMLELKFHEMKWNGMEMAWFLARTVLTEMTVFVLEILAV